MSVEENKYKLRHASIMNCRHQDTKLIKDGMKSTISHCNNCGMFIVKKKSD